MFPESISWPFTGLHADIPAGWERDTSMDDKYPKGTDAGVNPNVTGGNATHEHTSPAHTHNIVAHTHTLTIGGASGSNVDSGSGSGGGRNFHTHSGGSITSGAVSGASVSSESATYSAVSNDPPFHEIIWIKPSSPKGSLPDEVCALFDDPDFVNDEGIYKGFFICDGNNGTENMDDKYLRGASTGEDAGDTGGSLSNTHTVNHAHSVQHAHGSVVTSGISAQNARQSGNDMSDAAHTHTITPNSHSGTTTDSPSILMDEVVEPAYTKLLMIQNKSGHPAKIKGLIGIYKGLLSAIPPAYDLMDGTLGVDMRGRHLKITSNPAEIGDTGGSNTHTHAAKSHSHNMGNHSHTVPDVSGGNPTRHNGNSAGGVSNHIHQITSSSDNLSLDSQTTTGNSSNNEPPYRTVAFVKLVRIVKGGSFLLNFV